MTEEARNHPVGALGVIDIETMPDPYALALLDDRGRVKGKSAATHRIVAMSTLRAVEDDRGWTVTGIASLHGHSDVDERDMLLAADDLLSWAGQGGIVASFNGDRHDLVVLRRRAARHLMPDLGGVGSSARLAHRDLMTSPALAGGGWYSLREAAAGLGIPVAHRLSTRGLGTPKLIQKGQTDVSVTFLLFLYDLAMRRGEAGVVEKGWRALGDYVRGMGPHGDHLAQFRRHPLGGGADA